MSSSVDILLAEDEEHISKLVAFKLTREGYRVTVAENGQEAIDRLLSTRWALIILDVMMPICDGWEVLRRIRAESALSDVPILMLTAKGNRLDLAQAMNLGAEEYLKKPFDPVHLAELVRKIVVGKS